jgi:hypothetical protein
MPADDESRNKKPLPFEPEANKQRKPDGKKKPKNAPVVKAKATASRESSQIPDVVSKRMIQRALIFSGIPVVLGMGIFIVSYIIVSQHIAKLPNTLVLLVSMAFLGLSVVGLSYGILSASWEEAEDAKGSTLGWQEFRVNFSRMAGAYKDSKGQSAGNR